MTPSTCQPDRRCSRVLVVIACIGGLGIPFLVAGGPIALRGAVWALMVASYYGWVRLYGARDAIHGAIVVGLLSIASAVFIDLFSEIAKRYGP